MGVVGSHVRRSQETAPRVGAQTAEARIMNTHCPPTRRRFATPWDEIQYLREKVLFWFYGTRSRPDRARPFARRLAKLLPAVDSKQESILGQECRSLICELNGDLAGAIRHREREITRIRRLHE